MATGNIFDLTNDGPLTLELDQLQDLPKHGKPSAGIWIVFPCVDTKAIAKGTLFGSTYNYALEQAIQQAGFSLGEFFVTTVYDQPVSNFAAVNQFSIPERLADSFAGMARQYKPKLIILVGEACLNAFTDQQGIDKWLFSFLHI